MIIVGLTGGIGAGKTFVANEFLIRGVPVYNSDIRAKELMDCHPSIKKELINKFGTEAYNNNLLNHKFIADKIFANKPLLNWINKLVHPKVQTDFEDWTTKQLAKFVIKEAAILIESKAYQQCNKIIVVTAPEKLRIERVALRDNLAPSEVAKRIKNQMTDVERLNYADYIVVNDGAAIVHEQLEKIYKELLEYSNSFTTD